MGNQKGLQRCIVFPPSILRARILQRWLNDLPFLSFLAHVSRLQCKEREAPCRVFQQLIFYINLIGIR